METPLLFRSAPHLQSQRKVSWIPLIHAPTPVHELEGAAELLGHRLYVKREDATDPCPGSYGGNKVRNLEFLLGTALARGAKNLVTVAPYGSNFAAALSAQAKRIGLPNEVFHFVPDLSPQMHAHASFSASCGSSLTVFRGGRYIGLARAQMRALFKQMNGAHTAILPSGGSNALGVLGHINAVFELEKQIRAGEIPEPDLMVVGVGTCGTMAGLLAGIKILGLKTKVIGVRCVDPLVCNPLRVSYLANSALRLLGASTRVRMSEVDLRDGEQNIPYGLPLPNAADLIARVRRSSGITLDTTYTTKVFSHLKTMAKRGESEGKDVLYWNTYSPSATAGSSGRESFCLSAARAPYLGRLGKPA